MLLVTGVLLYFSEKIKSHNQPLNLKIAGLVGISQAIAILPGISRSGATISTSLLLGLSKEEASRFSFLMVIPLILGKMVKDILSGDFMNHMPSTTYLILGFSAAFVSGVLACKFMIAIIKRTQLKWFAYYCFLVGSAIIIYMLMM